MQKVLHFPVRCHFRKFCTSSLWVECTYTEEAVVSYPAVEFPWGWFLTQSLEADCWCGRLPLALPESPRLHQLVFILASHILMTFLHFPCFTFWFVATEWLASQQAIPFASTWIRRPLLYRLILLGQLTECHNAECFCDSSVRELPGIWCFGPTSRDQHCFKFRQQLCEIQLKVPVKCFCFVINGFKTNISPHTKHKAKLQNIMHLKLWMLDGDSKQSHLWE